MSVEIVKVATTAQYGGSASAVYFGLTANETAIKACTTVEQLAALQLSWPK
jgi:hypothetical protein